MKKLVALLLAVLFVATALPAAVAEGPVEIEYWFGLGGRLGDLFLEMIAEYNASQDKVHVTGVQFADYTAAEQGFQAALAAGTAPAAMHMSPGPRHAFENYLEPLNDRYEADADFNASDILGGALKGMYALDGKTLIGVPLFAATQVMYYRKDAFEGYDIDETFSKWENLEKAVYELAKKDDAGETSFYGWEIMWGFQNVYDAVLCAGGDIYTDETMRTVNFLSDEWVKVMTAFDKWLNKDKVMRIHSGGTGWEYWYETIDDVMEGRAAGYIGSAADQGDLDFNVIGCYRQPAWGDNDTNQITDVHLVVIPQSVSAEQKDAAWDFAKFLSRPESQVKITMEAGYTCTRSSCLTMPDFAAYCEANPQVAAIMDAVDNGSSRFYDCTGGYVYTPMVDMVDRVELQGMDPVEALTLCQEEAQAALDEYWAEKDAE